MAESDEFRSEWTGNYFNYFTEVEEHFRKARGTGLFLLSPLDWALLESWRASGVPLAAVLRGIDEAFEKWRGRKKRRQTINSLAYCAQAVLENANRSGDAANQTGTPRPFEAEEIRQHLLRASSRLREMAHEPLGEVAAALEALAASPEKYAEDLESLEQRLSAMEDKIAAVLRGRESEEELYAMRSALDAELRPYRGKMAAAQLDMLERRYLDTALFEKARLPRLSLFYLH